jgi:choline-sulfatase
MASTLFVFTSDHGDYGGHRGLYTKVPWIPFEDLLRVPLVVAGGVVEAPGRSVPTLVQSSSFAATCLDYAGLRASEGVLDFPSLRPHLAGRDEGDDDRPVVAAISVGFPTLQLGRHKVIGSWSTGEAVLFDLDDDPGETRSLARDPALARVMERASQVIGAEVTRPEPDLAVGWASDRASA